MGNERFNAVVEQFDDCCLQTLWIDFVVQLAKVRGNGYLRFTLLVAIEHGELTVM